MSTLYPKIMSPFKRFTEGEMRNKLDQSTWSRPEFDLLSDLKWTWTEKVDGTNIRVLWDGYKVEFGGRTENAQIPAKLITRLRELFPEQLMEQQFGVNAAVLYGEGYGAQIQKGGGNYRAYQDFVLFDVKVGPWWLLPDAVEGVASSLKIGVVPTTLVARVQEAIDYVSVGMLSAWGNFTAEGLVGRLPLGLQARDGDRLLMKIKTEDFC